MLTAKQLDAKFPRTEVVFPKKGERKLDVIGFRETIKSINPPPKTKGLSFVMASTDMTLHESYKKKIENKTLSEYEIFDIIVRVVGDVYKTDDIVRTNPCRKANIIEPRYMSIFLTRYMTDLSLNTIGKMFSPAHWLDHSTIIHACKCVMNKIDANDYDFTSNFYMVCDTLVKIYGIEINILYSERMPEWYKIIKQNG